MIQVAAIPLAAMLLALTTLVCGAVVLLGWVVDLPLLRTVVPGSVETKANTAIGLVAAGASLLSWLYASAGAARWLAAGLAAGVLALGVTNLGQYLLGWELGIDELMFRDPNILFTSSAGRMSPYSAAAFTTIGLALLALLVPRLRLLAMPLAVPTVLIGTVSLLGYAWNASEIVTDAMLPPVAVNAALGMSALGLATLAAAWQPARSVRRESQRGEFIRAKVITAFAAAMTLLIVGFGVFYRSLDRSAAAEAWVAHTQSVLAELSDVYSHVTEAVAAQRNYMVTGDTAYREASERRAVQALEHVDGLLRIAVDNEDQVRRISHLHNLVRSRLAALRGTTALFDHLGLEATRRHIAADNGLRLMAEIEDLVGEIRAVETGLLSTRKEAAADERTKLLALLLVLLVGLGTIFIILFYSVDRALHARARRDEEVRALNAALKEGLRERSAALQALHAKEQELRTMVDSMPDGVITFDGTGSIRSANAAVTTLLGYTSRDLIGRSVSSLLPELRGEGPGGFIEGSVGGTGRVIGTAREMDGIRQDGQPVPLEVAVSAYPVEDGRCFVGILHDISERRRFIAEIMQSRRDAEEANRTKSTFLATMSHEIRTPLNGIIGNLELLSQTHLDDEQVGMLDDASKASLGLLALIGNILDFSKIEEGKFVFETGDVDITAIVEEAVHVLQSRARQKGCFIVSTIAADVPQVIRCDGPRIRQILLNLIGNAVKFTDRGGIHVDLSVSAWDREVCELCFAVHDSGRGFDQANAARLFDPFTQDLRNPGAIEGTGLGLSICRSLVSNFGGTIDCEGIAGAGATFRFTLPGAVVERGPAAEKADLAGRTVLIAGRSTQPHAHLESYFRNRGARVQTVGTLAEGYAIADNAAEKGQLCCDVAVLLTDDLGHCEARQVRRLRESCVVPLAFGPTATARTRRAALGCGFTMLIPEEAAAGYLDRNIRTVMGQAVARPSRVVSEPAPSAADTENLKNRRVLVLEDRLVNQTVIQRQLSKLGVSCTIASNGVKGLAALAKDSFDLILCDCSMPEMNGYDFTRVLRQREAATGDGRRLPVIALTANAFREDAEECFAAGMDDFVSKPITMERLATVMGRWLTTQGAHVPLSEAEVAPVEAPSVLDVAALSRIVGTDEPEVIDDLLDQFLASARQSFADVAAAIRAEERERIAAAAHGAKGESRSAAATELGDIYEAMEWHAPSGDIATLRELVESAAAALVRVEGVIRRRAAGQMERQ